MQYTDVIMGSMMMSTFSNITSLLKTDYILLDVIIICTIMIFIKLTENQKIKEKLNKYISDFLSDDKNEKTITFTFKRGEQSIRCKSLFHFIANRNTDNSHVKHLIEDIFKKWDYRSDEQKEIDNIYRVDQSESFSFTKSIKGRVYKEDKIDENVSGREKYKEIIHLEVFSLTESLKSIQEFIDNCKADYLQFQKEKLLENQYLINVEAPETKGKDSDSDNDLRISKEEWKSNVTFESRFFPDKEKHLETIDHFLNNEEWFKKKGLNHTLGILLYGDPGCGKTSFIKALMNYTKRHAIEIKLSDNFDFSDLKDIICDEEIDDDIIIPQKNRIIIIEDIDATGETVKDRKLKEKENKLAEDKFKEEIKKFMKESSTDLSKEVGPIGSDFVKIKDNISKKNNNNLSYLLNILDGTKETPGRIIIMTTNRPEILDEALVRPGRIDIKINFTKSVDINIKEILYHFWKNDDDTDKFLKDKIFNYDVNEFNSIFTPAELIDFCRKTNSFEETIELMKKEKFIVEKAEQIFEMVNQNSDLLDKDDDLQNNSSTEDDDV